MAPESSRPSIRVWQAVILIVLLIVAFVFLLYGCEGSNCPWDNNNNFNNNNNNFNNNNNNFTALPSPGLSVWA